MNYTESNKLIAEFMGYTEHNHGSYKTYTHVSAPDRNYLINQLRYHEDWNALMPVVEKIESTELKTQFEHYKCFPYRISKNFFSVMCHSGVRQDGLIYQTPYGSIPETTIQAVYDGVIQFITWYNSNQ